MKKCLLFTLAIGISISVSAQKTMSNYTGPKAKIAAKPKMDAPYSPSKMVKSVKKRNNVATAKKSAVSSVYIGTAINAYGFYSNGRTYLWADNNLNSVIFTHRGDAVPGGGFLMTDISTDRGVNWAANYGPVYSPDGEANFDARYPQGAIYNPAGNTDPANAYAAYFATTLDGSNGPDGWGGTAYGVQSLDMTSAPTQASFTSNEQYKALIPDAFHITQTGVAWSVEMNYDLAADKYLDSLIVYKGIFNTGTHQYDYTRSLFACPLTLYDAASYGSPVLTDLKIAFAPDGQTGYISMLGHNDFSFMPDSVYYPILYKTTDGGDTWNGPINVDITSIPGIQAIWPGGNYLYTAGFEHDLAVDANGNPYLTFDACLAPGGWYIATAPGYIASTVVYSTDGGTNWDGQILGMLQTFRGDFGEISSDNRNQIATTMDGTKMFMTWLDTDTLTWGEYCNGDNTFPDIHVKALDCATGKTTPEYIPSLGTDGESSAFMGSTSYYVFGTTGTYEVPLVFQMMDPSVPGNAVQYVYLQGFTVDDASFTISSVTGGGYYCEGEAGVEVGLSGSETGVNYQLQLDGVDLGSAIPGTGSALSFGEQTVTGVYTVIGIDAVTSDITNMTGNTFVIMSPYMHANVTVVDVETGGSITANPTGGFPPYSYAWSSTTIDTIAIINLTECTYSLTVSDALGCTTDTTVTLVNIICTGISENSLHSNINVIPNPSNGNFTMQINGFENRGLDFSIVNLQGQAIISEKMYVNSDNFSKQINIENFAKGMYYIKVIDQNESRIFKLMIQ